MRNLLKTLLLALLIVGMAGCKKDKANKKTLSGTWELRYMQAGFVPEEFPAGNNNLLKFHHNQYEIHKDGAVVKSGTYETRSERSAHLSLCTGDGPGSPDKRIVFDGDNSEPKQFYTLKQDTLVIMSGCFAIDAGLIKRYVKIAD